jgi:hypothetical protein
MNHLDEKECDAEKCDAEKITRYLMNLAGYSKSDALICTTKFFTKYKSNELLCTNSIF